MAVVEDNNQADSADHRNGHVLWQSISGSRSMKGYNGKFNGVTLDIGCAREGNQGGAPYFLFRFLVAEELNICGSGILMRYFRIQSELSQFVPRTGPRLENLSVSLDIIAVSRAMPDSLQTEKMEKLGVPLISPSHELVQ